MLELLIRRLKFFILKKISKDLVKNSKNYQKYSIKYTSDDKSSKLSSYLHYFGPLLTLKRLGVVSERW